MELSDTLCVQIIWTNLKVLDSLKTYLPLAFTKSILCNTKYYTKSEITPYILILKKTNFRFITFLIGEST